MNKEKLTTLPACVPCPSAVAVSGPDSKRVDYTRASSTHTVNT